MFGKPEWFDRRKYGGWGLTPKTREGWLYIGAIILPLALFQMLPFWDAQARWLALSLWAAFVAFDVFDIMLRMKKDERETMHEAIAERNAAWVMILVLSLGILYQAVSSGLSGQPHIDPVLIAVLFAGLIAKACTNWKLSREN
ncbi:Uncharacterised protein [Candidatus Anstonella stagnisolia]|nr:Uncharacterised protein [Candidatus Anstonella stagnisolia]